MAAMATDVGQTHPLPPPPPPLGDRSDSSADDGCVSGRGGGGWGVVLPDGRLDVDRIRREISSESRSYDLHRAEDEMKKRAIHSSKDYDEFKNFVRASQLRPVGRTEMAELFRPSSTASTSSSYGSVEGFSAPKNRLCRNTEAARREDEARRRKMRMTRLKECSVSRSGGDFDFETGTAVAPASGPTPTMSWALAADPKKEDITKRDKKKKKKASKKKGDKKKKRDEVGVGESTWPASADFEREWRRRMRGGGGEKRFGCGEGLRFLSSLDQEDDNKWEHDSCCRSLVEEDAGHQKKIGGMKWRFRLDPHELSRTTFRVEMDASVLGEIIEALALLASEEAPLPLHVLSSGAAKEDEAEAVAEADINLAAIFEGDIKCFGVDGNKTGSTYNFGVDMQRQVDGSISDATLSHRARFVHMWLDAMMRSGRFGINVQFLSDQQRDAAAVLCRFLDQHLGESSDRKYADNNVENLRQAYVRHP